MIEVAEAMGNKFRFPQIAEKQTFRTKHFLKCVRSYQEALDFFDPRNRALPKEASFQNLELIVFWGGSISGDRARRNHNANPL